MLSNIKISLFALSALLNIQNVQAGTIPITGPSGGIQVRQDISVMQNAGPVFDLYILALQRFQTSNDTTSLKSWFQIAGIHGLPQVPWDGEAGTNDGVGFCTHGSILFPTWHRPYVSVYEQAVYSTVQDIAQQYPADKRDAYVQAAQGFRVPYWDWSMNSSLPDAANSPNITVTTPQGVQTIRNPLFSYTWQNSEVKPAGTNTFRALSAQANLAGSMKQFHQLVYNMLTSVPRFDFFGDANTNDLFPTPGIIINPQFAPKATWSVESIHNTIHNTIGGLFGGGGTMGDLELAAFDPIFWLHHTNVDRIFAIWQAVYPDSYLEPFAAGQDSWWFAAGDMQDTDTPLLPFHADDKGTNLTSTTVKNILNFGYTYPELQDVERGTAAEISAKTRTLINQKYNPLGQITGGFQAGMFNCSLSAPVCKRDTPSSNTVVSLSNAADHQWVVSMNINESVLNETITLAFFLDKPASSDPSSWASDPALAAVQPVMIKQGQQAGSNKIITRSVFLTHALIGKMSDLSEATVLPYLQPRLQWRATWSDGTVIDATTMAKMQAVSIVLNEQAVQQTPNQPDAFPIYGDWVGHGFGLLGANGDYVVVK